MSNINDGILTTSSSFNHNFLTLLSYYDITPGSLYPMWGINNKAFSYFACRDYPDQINLYRFQRLAKGGLKARGVTFLECADSTGTLNMPFKYHMYHSWEALPEYIEDDYDLCIRSVVEHQTKSNTHTTILWSGGVDSSTILSGFIKYGDKNKFTVAYTTGSIEEYPLFYNYLIKNNYNLKSLDTCNLSDLDGTITHGVGGGVICDTAPSFSEASIFDLTWHHSIIKDEWTTEEYNSLYEFTESYMKNYGKNNPTVADLCLFANMGTKSNNSVMHMHYDKELQKEKLLSFYDFDEFRRWNYYHASKYMIGSHNTNIYKLPAKKIIYSVLKDQDYIDTKGKGFSQDLWKKKCRIDIHNNTPHDYMFIDYNNERIMANSKNEFFEKYGTRFDHYFNKT